MTDPIIDFAKSLLNEGLSYATDRDFAKALLERQERIDELERSRFVFDDYPDIYKEVNDLRARLDALRAAAEDAFDIMLHTPGIRDDELPQFSRAIEASREPKEEP